MFTINHQKFHKKKIRILPKCDKIIKKTAHLSKKKDYYTIFSLYLQSNV